MSEIEEENAKAKRTAEAWRTRGPAGLSKAVTGLCSQDTVLSEAAQRVLVEWGPAAVKPLLIAIAKDLGATDGEVLCLQAASETVGEMLCHAGRPSAQEDQLTDPSRDDPKSYARAQRTVRAALRPALMALSGRNKAMADAALTIVDDVALNEECPNREILLTMSVGAIIELLDAATSGKKAHLIQVLSHFGPIGAAAVPQALELLSVEALQSDAIRLLGAVGPASVPAVPKLRSLLKGTHAAAAARALGEIGPAAGAALPDLISLLAEANRNGCDKPVMAGALAMSIGRIGAAGDTDSSAASGILIATLRICPSLEEDFVNALGALGARASAVGPTLLLIAKDESRPLDRRALASRWLWELGTAVEPRDQALLLALEKKRSLLASGWTWDVSQVQEPKFEKGSSLERKNERWIAAKRAAHQIDICREEIGLSPLDGESVQEWSQSDSEVSTIQRIAACLEKRLCGPNHESYLTSMSRCCRGAFAKKRPSWCPAD